MREVLEIVLSWVAVGVGTFLVVSRDERRLTTEQRARAWPPATRLMVFWGAPFFGILVLLAVPIHYARTRRSLGGFAVGVSFAALVFGATYGAIELVDLACDALHLG